MKKAIYKKISSEHKLMELVEKLFPRGSWMTTCAKRDKDCNSKKYLAAKKRYIETLNECSKCIEELKSYIQLLEDEMTQKTL